MSPMRFSALLAAAFALSSAAQPPDYRQDARDLDRIIVENYAYAERLPEPSAVLDRAREAVDSRKALLAYAERRIASLADHHAITGSSFDDSWALVPTYADIWIEKIGNDFVVDAVRERSPAALAQVKRGDVLVAVAGIPTANAVRDYWQDLGLPVTEDRALYAARVLAAGRRDRVRDLTFRGTNGPRRLTLANLYGARPSRPPLETLVVRQREVRPDQPSAIIKFNDSLGDTATIAAFDAFMAGLNPREVIEIDLTDTPSGGNTTVARAIMGWFVTKATGYQVHSLPSALRTTGIARQWVEQVLPRPGKLHQGRVTVRVGRWTGSMGEGLAIGFAAIGARVYGERMAGLRGAVYDFRLPQSGLTVKLPAERLMTLDGQPREAFVPLDRAQ